MKQTKGYTMKTQIPQSKTWAYADVLIDLDQANEVYGQDVMKSVTHKFEGARVQNVSVYNIREEKVNGQTTVVGDLLSVKYYETGSDMVQEIAQAFDFVPNENFSGIHGQVGRYQERYWAKVNN